MKTLIVLVITICSMSLASGQEPAPAGAPNHDPIPEQYQLEILPKRTDVVSWETLAQVETVQKKDRFIPKFSAAVAALNNKKIKLQGFLMPLDPTEKQRHFLISANAPTCSFCLPGGAESLVEVYSTQPIAYTFDPIVITGTLRVLHDDADGLYYQIKNATLVIDH